MPGDANPMPAANRAASRVHWSGKSVGLLPSAVFIVRCALPTSSWFEMIDSAFFHPSSPRGAVSRFTNASMSVFWPRDAAWMSPGLLLSLISLCWNSVYHCASKPPPVPSAFAGREMAGS